MVSLQLLTTILAQEKSQEKIAALNKKKQILTKQEIGTTSIPAH